MTICLETLESKAILLVFDSRVSNLQKLIGLVLVFFAILEICPVKLKFFSENT